MKLTAAGILSAGPDGQVPFARLKSIRAEFGLSLRTPRFQQILLGAVSDLFARSGLRKEDLSSDTGTVVASMLGPQGMISGFQNDLLDYPEDQVMAGTFSHSVHNAPAGGIAILFGLKGPTYSVTGFEQLFPQTLKLVQSLFLANACRRILLMAGEERTAVSEAIRTVRSDLPCESAAAFLLEDDGTDALPSIPADNYLAYAEFFFKENKSC